MDEDMILPEGFELPPQTEEVAAETQETGAEGLETQDAGEDTKPPEEGVEAKEEPVSQPQKVKIKFNHEERELDIEEAATLAQKGLNYEKAVERARQEAAQAARDAVIAEMGYSWNGKPITTEAEYRQAKAEQELIQKYQDRDLPEEVIKELIENRRDREERAREKAAKEQEAQSLAKWNELFDYFKDVNERDFDPQKDALPAEVEEAIKSGQSPLQAYMKYHSKQLRNQLKIAQTNQANTKKAPVGSVTAGGSKPAEAEDLFLKGFNSI